MRFSGTVTIQAPREKVWAFLTDPHAVSQCAPGLKSLEIVVPDQKFRVVAAVGFGATRVTFANDVEFVALDPPNHATLKAHGTAPGSAADVTSEMQLVAVSAETTELQWSADVVVLGTIASLAARLAYSNFRFD